MDFPRICSWNCLPKGHNGERVTLSSHPHWSNVALWALTFLPCPAGSRRRLRRNPEDDKARGVDELRRQAGQRLCAQVPSAAAAAGDRLGGAEAVQGTDGGAQRAGVGDAQHTLLRAAETLQLRIMMPFPLL